VKKAEWKLSGFNEDISYEVINISSIYDYKEEKLSSTSADLLHNIAKYAYLASKQGFGINLTPP